MVTTYDDTPRFRDRLSGANLGVLGTIEDILETTVDRSGQEPQVQTIVRFKAEDVFFGEIDDDDLKVRIVGGETDEARTESTVPLKRDQQLFMLLARDYTPEQETERFVPYFSSGYPLDEEDRIRVDEKTASELREMDYQVQDQQIALDELREIVDRTLTEQKEKTDRVPSAEREEAQTATVSEVSEMPTHEDGGPVSSSPQEERKSE